MLNETEFVNNQQMIKILTSTFHSVMQVRGDRGGSPVVQLIAMLGRRNPTSDQLGTWSCTEAAR